MTDNMEWTEELTLDLEQLVELANPEKITLTDKIKLREGERRFVTVLFLDMKGFTALSERFDHEVIDRIIDRLFTIFKGQIEKRGGWVEKFEGDAIMAAFGTKIAHEDDAVRAIDAGLAILDSLRQVQPILKKQDIEVSVRIGIHSGEVTKSRRVREYDVITGDTVNTAARLEQNAEPGTLLISAVTKNLARDRFIFADHQKIKAMGKQEPITVFTVAGKASSKEHQDRYPATFRTRFVGREKELHLLSECYKRCCHQVKLPEEAFFTTRHLLVEIQAEAGMGKSRLVHEFLKRVSIPEQILRGTAVSFASRPCETIISMLLDTLGLPTFCPEVKPGLENHLENLTGFSENAAELKKALPMLGYLLGVKTEDPRFTHLKPDQVQLEIFIAFRTFVQAISRKIFDEHQKPVILVFEDFHWIDDSSQGALKFLIETTVTPLPLMILAPCRPEGKRITVSERRTDTLEILLESLEDSDELSMIQGMLNTLEIPRALKEIIRKQASGNPYYIEELVHHLIDRDILFKKDGSWQCKETKGDIEVPSSLRGLLLARIDSLDHKIRTTLQHASVLGTEFFIKTLQWIENRIEEGIEPQTALSELVCLSYLIPHETFDQAYLFKHILTRNVAYDTLLQSNRRVLHHLCALFIEEKHGDNLEPHYFELGEHWLAAAEKEKAVDYFLRAGEYFEKSYDNHKAIDAFSKAIGLLPESDTRMGQSLRNRGQVYQLTGRMGEAMQDFELSLSIAREQGDFPGEAHSLNSIGSIHNGQGRYDEAMKEYHQALEIRRKLGDCRGEANSLNNVGNIHRDQGRSDEAMKWFQQALEIQREVGDRRGEAQSSYNISIIHHDQGRSDEAMTWVQQALEIDRELGDRRGESSSYNNIGVIHHVQGRYDEAMKWYQQALEIRRELGDRSGEAYLLHNIGVTHHVQGRSDEAMKWFQKALEISRELGDRRSESISYGAIGSIHLNMGRYDEAMKWFQQALEVGRELGVHRVEASSLHDIGNIHHVQGRYDEAMKCYQHALEIRRKLGYRSGEAYSLHDIGLIHGHQCKHSDAEYYFSQAAMIRDKDGAAHLAVLSRSMQARSLFFSSDHEKAAMISQRCIKALSELDPDRKNREMEPEQILFTHYLILKHRNDPETDKYLEESWKVLKEFTGKITDPNGRTTVLNTPMNRPIIAALDKYLSGQAQSL